MRILFVSGCAWGGSLASTRELAVHVRQPGCESFLLARKPMGTRLQPRLHKRLENLHAKLAASPVHGLASWLARQPGSEPTRFDGADPRVPEWRSPVPANACLGLATRLGCDTVVVASVLRPQWRQIQHDLRTNGVRCVLYLREDALLGHLDPASPPDLLIANSKVLQREASERGLDCEFVPSPVRAPALPADGPREHVLIVNFDEPYGGETALHLATRCPEVPFVFQDSWNRMSHRIETLSARIDELGLRNVVVRPFDPCLEEVYSGARVLLTPYSRSIRNARPRTVMEGLACGLPVLASDLPGLREVAGDAGIYVSPEAPIENWTAALRSLWLDREGYEALARRARQRFRAERVTGSDVAARFLAVLTKDSGLTGGRAAVR